MLVINLSSKEHFLNLDLNQGPSDCQAYALPTMLLRLDGIEVLAIHLKAVGSNPYSDKHDGEIILICIILNHFDFNMLLWLTFYPPRSEVNPVSVPAP